MPVAPCSVGSGILNLTFDFTFVFYAFSPDCYFFAKACHGLRVWQKKKNFDLSDFLKCFVFMWWGFSHYWLY